MTVRFQIGLPALASSATSGTLKEQRAEVWVRPADNPDPVIVCDTRKQEPLVFTRLRSVRGTLTTGDYGILGAEHAAAIERKSVDDLVACCGPEGERFERGCERGGVAISSSTGSP